ncbi:MAG: hypothetical protein O9262_13760, partial [Cyclobacteriaceae bacterium]|nr:hypothetical protein [Cyclobacteriaceae bacterium]
MKGNVSMYVSIATLVILIGYITYNESGAGKSAAVEAMSDNTTGLVPEIPTGFVAKPFRIPEKLDFAQEPVPLHINDVRERIDRELQINSYLHSSTLFIIKRANRWLPQIEKILKENGVP